MNFKVVCHTESIYGLETYSFLLEKGWPVELLTKWSVAKPVDIVVYHVDALRLDPGDKRTAVPPFLYQHCIPIWAANSLLGVGLVNNPQEDEQTAGYLLFCLGCYRNFMKTKRIGTLPWSARESNKNYQALSNWEDKVIKMLEENSQLVK